MILHHPPVPGNIPPIQVGCLEAAITGSKSIGSGFPVVTCPNCGDEHCHLVATGALQGSVLMLLAGDGTHRITGVSPTGARGSTVATVYQCESGHAFAATATFFKGRTFTRMTELASVAGCDLPTLWRD